MSKLNWKSNIFLIVNYRRDFILYPSPSSVKLVIKIGGSTLYDEYEIKMDLIRHWVKVIKKLRSEGHRIGVDHGTSFQ